MDQKPAKQLPYSLFGKDGQRKYLNPDERALFIKTCEAADDHTVRTFGLMLAHGGCRISEALEMTADRIDFTDRAVVFESLKKRQRGVFRSVPVPPAFLDSLNMVHDIRITQKRGDRGKGVQLWPWSRSTASVRIDELMAAAGITGLQATPKGLRHAFAIHAIGRNVPLNVVQELLGHADMKTTAIYAQFQGAEKRKIVERMWDED